MQRQAILVLALLFIGGLAFLTINGAVRDGITGLVVVSVVVLALLGFGVVGALTTPSDED